MRVDRRPMWSMVPAMSPIFRKSPDAHRLVEEQRRARDHVLERFLRREGHRNPSDTQPASAGVGSTRSRRSGPSCPRRSPAGRTPCATGERDAPARGVRPKRRRMNCSISPFRRTSARHGGDVDQARGVGPDLATEATAAAVARTQRIANARSRRRTGAGRTLPANRSDWRKIRRTIRESAASGPGSGVPSRRRRAAGPGER